MVRTGGWTLGLWLIQVGGRSAGSDGDVGGVEWVRWGPGAGLDVEGSRPSDRGTNANENWADLSEGELRP